MSQVDVSAATGVDDTAVARAPALKAIYVYEAPVRLWHWINALAITVLAVTGYLIGSPPAAVPGEASANFLFGYLCFVHFVAGHVLVVGLLVRAYWAIVGNAHARELFSVPIFTTAYWREVATMLQWYAFLRRAPNRYVGHNPLARMAMFAVFLLTAIFMVITGFALYGEGAQEGHWAHALFTSWVVPLFGQSQNVHTWHHVGMWLIITFVIFHVYAAVREDIMGRQSIISTMVSGYRMFKD
jgi:Ni/Fe-hydrogenase 1 B-type cytochrome subunit